MAWAAIFVVTSVGYAVVAPIVDDLRSSMRVMETECRVIRVIDGDTVEIGCPKEVREGRSFSARIVGYDTPELYSPQCDAELVAAEAASTALTQILRGGGAMVGQGEAGLEVAFLGADKYDRILVDLRVDGERVTTAMVARGHGRRYLGGLRGGWC